VGAVTELLEVGVIDLFSVGVGFESVSRYKPHPEGVLLALSQLGANAEETVMVGDSPADIEAGKAAGCWSCHATWGVPATERSLAGIGADLVAEMPEALLTLPLS
jgi:phosphoglycolate phosphatase-like HAD superfamily hydrolase